jgi:hypothetical protein
VDSALSAAQQQAIRNASEKLGVKPRPSQITGSQTVSDLEDALANMPGGSGVWRNFNAANREAVNRAAAQSIGSNAPSPTSAVLAEQKAALGAQYEALQKATKMPVVGDVFDAINNAENILNRGATIKGKGEALGVISSLKEKLWNTKELSGADYQAWTSDLSSMARSTDNNTVKASLKMIEKAMDKAARETNADKWAAADAAWANLKTLLRPNVVNEVTGDVSPRSVYTALQQGGREALKTGKLSGPLVDIAEYGKAMPALREGSQTFRRGKFGELSSLVMAPFAWGASKGMTNDLGRSYLSGFGHPEIARGMGGLLGGGAIPLSLAEIQLLMEGRQ